jgi:hypothetical protein
MDWLTPGAASLRDWPYGAVPDDQGAEAMRRHVCNAVFRAIEAMSWPQD